MYEKLTFCECRVTRIFSTYC